MGFDIYGHLQIMIFALLFLLSTLFVGRVDGFGAKPPLFSVKALPTVLSHQSCKVYTQESYLPLRTLRSRLETSLNSVGADEVPQKDMNYKISSITEHAPTPPTPTLHEKVMSFVKSNWLVIGEVLAIILASKNPSIGITGGPLKPEFTVSKVGVFLIFFINGLALNLARAGDPAETTSSTKINTLIQSYNFLFIPLVAKLLSPLYPHSQYANGILLLSCLPGTINVCVAQTLSAGGNMGTAIFNAIFSNVLGVVLTPLLAFWIVGTAGGGGSSLARLLGTLRKLGSVVIFPLLLGQAVRRSPLGNFFLRINKYSRTLSSSLLLGIVYNVFCDTFAKGLPIRGMELVVLTLTMSLGYLAFSAFFWSLSKKLLPGLDTPTRGAALLCSSGKTLAFGLPFIKTAFGAAGGEVAYLLAPLLIYSPVELLLGSSVCVPIIRNKIQKESNFEEGGGI